MELKQVCFVLLDLSPALLIVPYGIETVDTPVQVYNLFLLIVPYGIETPYSVGRQHW